MPQACGNRNDGMVAGLWGYFAPAGVATQPYWPPSFRGRRWSFLHGRGWRITNTPAPDGGKP